MTNKNTQKLTKTAVYEMVKADYTMFYRPMPPEIKELFPVFLITDSENCGLHWTTNHTGKMAGNVSCSTTCKTNRFCRKRIENAFRLVKPDFCLDTATKEDVKECRRLLAEYIRKNPEAKNVSICGFCFSDKQQDNYKTMTPCLDRNAKILNGGIIHSDWIPFINAGVVREKSFGDFASVIAATNGVNFVIHNPHAYFGIWSKNPALFHKVFKGDPANKPANMNLILSSQYINKKAVINPAHKYMIDATFTVYTKEYAEKHNVAINCGARACLACLRCYKKHNDVVDVTELLK